MWHLQFLLTGLSRDLTIDGPLLQMFCGLSEGVYCREKNLCVCEICLLMVLLQSICNFFFVHLLSLIQFSTRQFSSWGPQNISKFCFLVLRFCAVLPYFLPSFCFLQNMFECRLLLLIFCLLFLLFLFVTFFP